ncbi:MAG: Stage sporulation protein [Candidatus Saccharibacteria bacterium]|nr:Stage sporulation protein [Candidatus Saccharibacteria bacterium]
MRAQTMRRPVVLDKAQTQRRHKPDYWLVILSALLLVVGLIVVYSISPGLAAVRNVNENYFVSKQLIAILLGIVTFIVVAAVPLHKWKEWQRPLIIAAAGAAIAVRLFGEQVNGAYRWIHIGGLSFQAVELIKFALLISLAAFLAQQIQKGKMNDKEKTLKPFLIILGTVGFVVAGIQSDLGSTGVIVAMMAAMAFVAGLPLKRIAMIGGIVLIGLILAVSTTAYRRDRLATFLNPTSDCTTTGYQACQALIAVGSGGMFGKGLAHSGQAYGYLPEAANDSIFAIYAEKFGFVGVTALLVLFLAFFTRLKNIMERAPDDFSRLIMVGILAWLSTQAFINIGAMIGLLPLKGITLPFISYGGTSIIFVTAALGLAFNISRYTTYGVNMSSQPETRRTDKPTAGSRNDIFGYSSRRR